MESLIACVDVDYRSTFAVAAGLWFRGWTAAEPESRATVRFDDVAPYEPGAFYRRELPCLLGVLERGPQPDVIVVDGYVWLEAGRPGLGAHLHRALDYKPIVIGVAKTRYASASEAVPLCRGESHSPLYISAVGLSAAEAASRVASMFGEHRVPCLLREVDRLARTASPSAS